MRIGAASELIADCGMGIADRGMGKSPQKNAKNTKTRSDEMADCRIWGCGDSGGRREEYRKMLGRKMGQRDFGLGVGDGFGKEWGFGVGDGKFISTVGF
jgi:hypothetical protein